MEIMEVVWELGKASVFEVRDELSKRRQVARNTVRTMMERLEEKGWLTHRVIGRTYFYSALVPRDVSIGQRRHPARSADATEPHELQHPPAI